MADSQTNRRLAAVLAADVVGYSQMMGTDEAGTLAALKRHRETIFNPAVAAHRGRIVKLIGDGTLVEFSSVVDAVKCAVAIQRAVKAEGQPTGKGIVLRIGVNLGDVIIEGDDIYGDGVNVAARLEPLAEHGGVCIASIVNESVGNRIDASFRDGGEVAVKNIQRPIRVWKWHPDTDKGVAQTIRAAPVQESAREQPSIAVLPFDNMSGDPEQEYFSDGITEDIITDLSKIGGLVVIARNSSFTYKRKSVDIRTVGRELGVRSVLEGSIRRAGNRIRITAQLIEAATGSHLWAERYDRDLTDIFAVQDEVTRRIVDALKIKLTPAEEARIAETPTRNLDAHDLLLRARDLLLGPRSNREVFARVVSLAREASELDPGYAEPHAILGMAYTFDYLNRWNEDSDQSLRLAQECAEQSIQRNPDEPLGHIVAARVAIFEKHLEAATAEVSVALSLNRNAPLAYSILGHIQIYSGRPLDAIPHYEHAMRLDPAFNQQYLHSLGTAYLVAGKYETAAAIFKQRILLAPETDFSRAFLASALGYLGDVDEARRIWAELRKINPKYSLTEHLGRLPFRDPADPGRIAEGLAKAGLPD
jgi:adenylate cyclase